MVQYFSEGVFNCGVKNLRREDIVEINTYIQEIEDTLGFVFPQVAVGEISRNRMRLHYDPVLAYSKPLWYYAGVQSLDFLSDMILRSIGFTRKKAGVLSYWILNNEAIGNAGGDSNRDKSEAPLMFIHGVGIGLATYITFIVKLVIAKKRCLSLASTHQPIILLELPHVSMKLNVDIIPSMTTTVNCIEDALHQNHFEKAQFVVHSLGTFVFGAIQYMKPNLVKSVVMIDPTCFKLWEPSTMYNFCYRTPSTAMQIMMHFHITHELTISHFFHRHFNWTDCVMFADNLPSHTSIILSELDEIIEAKNVYQYLLAQRKTPGHGYFDISMLEKRHHGEWNVHFDSMNIVIDRILTMARTIDEKRIIKRSDDVPNC